MDRYLGKPYRQRHTVTVSGGSDLVRFFISGSGEGGNGILPDDKDLRYQFRSNLSFHPMNNLNVDVNSAYSRYHFETTGYGNATDGLYFQVVRRPLNGPGTYSFDVLDSLLQLNIPQTDDRMLLGITTTWTPLKGMTHKLTIGYDDARLDQRYYHPLGYITDRPGALSQTNWSSKSLSTDYVVSQQLSATKDMKVTLSTGGQLVRTDRDSVSVLGLGLLFPGVATASSANLVTTAVAESHVITGGFLGQAVVAFKDRYFVTGGLRVDGNSAFGSALGLQAYPKASASYVISDEPFFPKSLGTWKLRGAYGWAGRAPGAFDALQTWNPQSYPPGGGTGFTPRNTGNPSLGPERSREWEAGFDAAVLKDRVTAEFSYYDRLTDNALLAVAIPASLGGNPLVPTQLENVGQFDNKGVELGMTGRIIERPNFAFELTGTLATNNSLVLQTGTATLFNVVTGQPAPVVRAAIKVVNGDKFEDPAPACDPTNPGGDGHACLQQNGFIGPNLPTRTISLSPTFRLPHQIVVTARGEYQGGSYVLQGAAHFLAQRGPYGTPSCDNVYRYVPWSEYDGALATGPTAKKTHPNLGYVDAADRVRCYKSVSTSDLFAWPATFYKLREVTVQAPVPWKIPRLQSALVTLSVRNVLSILPGQNRSQAPDAGAAGGNNSIDGLTFGYTDAIPAPAEFTFSLRATF
jgi:hypothetical protein